MLPNVRTSLRESAPVLEHAVVAVLAALAVLAVLAFTGPGAGSAHAGTGQSVQQAAFAEQGARGATGLTGNSGFSDCLAENPRLLVQYLVDESQSLQRTDPDNQRVKAVETTLALLANLPEATGTELDMQVSIATFGEDYTTVADWQELTPSSLGGLQDAAASLADRNNGLDTDYVLALDGANQSIAQAAAAATQGGETPPCKLVFWFTDGEYDIEERGTITKPYGTGTAAELEAQGRDLLCRPGGIADDLRRSQIYLDAVALTSNLNSEDQSFLGSIALGSAGGQSCGTVPVPATWTTGSYVPVEAADDLVLDIIQQVICSLGNCTPVEQPQDVAICPGEACPQGTYSFPVDPGIVAFDVLVVGGQSNFGMSVRSPGESGALAIPDGEGVAKAYGGADVTATWLSDTSALIHGEVVGSEAEGDWQVSLVAGGESGARGTIQVFVFGGLTPRVVGEPTLRAGETTEVSAEVVGPDGEAADLSVYSETRMTGSLVDPVSGERFAVEFRPGEGGVFVAAVTVPPTVESSTSRLVVTVTAVTASGLTLEPVSRTVSVPVLPPLVYPQVEPTSLQMSSVEGTDSSTGTLTLTAGEASGGCVWVSDAAFPQAPDSAGTVDVVLSPAPTSPQDCLRVESGESVTLDVTATPEAEANGSVQGAVTLELASDAEPARQTLVVPAAFEMAKPLDVAKAGVVGALLAILAVLAPLLLMWLLKWWNSGFTQTNHLQYAAIEVAIQDGNLVRRQPLPSRGSGMSSGAPGAGPGEGGGRDALLVSGDFGYLPGASGGRLRKMDVGGLHLFARSPFYKPFSPSEARAGSVGEVVVGGPSADTAEDGSWTQVDPSLSRVWVLAVPETSLGTYAEAAGGGGMASAGPLGSGAPHGAGPTGQGSGGFGAGGPAAGGPAAGGPGRVVPGASGPGSGGFGSGGFGSGSFRSGGASSGFDSPAAAGASRPLGGTAVLAPAVTGTLYVFATSTDVNEPRYLAKLAAGIERWRFTDAMNRIVAAQQSRSSTRGSGGGTSVDSARRRGGRAPDEPAGSGTSASQPRQPFGSGGGHGEGDSPFRGGPGGSPFGGGAGGSPFGSPDPQRPPSDEGPPSHPFGPSGPR